MPHNEESHFTASNGVELNEYGNLISGHPGVGRKAVYEARAEFFQHLRDEELGRWRDPEAPNFVVYKSTTDNPERVRVADEVTGRTAVYRRDWTDGSDHGDTAIRYYKAHPESEPWHFPEKGEVWVLTHNGTTSAYLYGEGSLFRNDRMPALLPTDANITAGHRIWPAEEAK